ncbi:MAG: PilZ domain-containing protein [Candidatus Omnitrophica bacterium]|nr:PilZ domain-containing protein [Candidatus Omnitrophota bacterium]MCM8831855.1 PilZ domain-containing protein [Candidatus Omnitrophota bacterium]
MTDKIQERRKFKRVNVNFIVIYRIHQPVKLRMFINDKEVYAIMIDLNEGGMAIVSSYQIPENTLLLIKFTLIDPTATFESRISKIELMGEVRYCILREDKSYRLGIRFTQIKEEDRLIISNFCKKIST